MHVDYGAFAPPHPDVAAYSIFSKILHDGSRFLMKSAPTYFPVSYTSNATIIKRADITNVKTTTTANDVPMIDGDWHIGNASIPND
jgi:hypothetical protein